MKILHLCLASFFIDNYSYQENLLPKYHKKMGNDVTVIASLFTFDSKGRRSYLENESEYISNDGYKVIRVDYTAFLKPINKFIRRYNNILRLLEEEKPDLIFIHGCQFWDIKQVVKYLKVNKNVKVFVDNHADLINSASNFFSNNILHKIIWKSCAKIIEPYAIKFFGVTPLRVDFLREMYDISPGKLELLVMGADSDKVDLANKSKIRESIREKHQISGDDFLIVTGGKIDKRKSIHLLMQAVKSIDNLKVKLLVFGTVNDELKEKITGLSDNTIVKYIGWINSDDVYNYFLAADLVAFPGTHSVLWEQAVGTGVPCLFRYWQGMNHIDVGGNCNFLLNDSVDEIVEAIENIINNEDVYNEMKVVSETKGVKEFSYLDIAKRSISI